MSSPGQTVVIGGGTIGVTTAYELVKRGEEVILLEAGQELAAEASYANGGLLTASMSDPWNSPGVGKHLLSSLFDPRAAMKLRVKAIPGLTVWGLKFLRNSSPARHRETTRCNFGLAQYSVEQTLALAEELGIAYDATSGGTMKVFDSEQALESSAALSKSLEPVGLHFETLTTDQVIEKEPELVNARDKIACGIYYRDDASGDACLYTRAIARKASEAGLQIETGQTVEGICARNGTVTGVRTRDREITASRVALCAGATSPALSRTVGVSIPVKPAKGYSVTVDMSSWTARPSLPIIDDAMHAGVVPMGDRIRFVGTAEFTGYDTTLSQERIDNLFALLERLYPHLASQVDMGTAEPWAGLRPMSSSGRPIIGPAGPSGFWINTGHGHLGWTMAVGSARLLAAQMLDNEAPLRPGPFWPAPE